MFSFLSKWTGKRPPAVGDEADDDAPLAPDTSPAFVPPSPFASAVQHELGSHPDREPAPESERDGGT